MIADITTLVDLCKNSGIDIVVELPSRAEAALKGIYSSSGPIGAGNSVGAAFRKDRLVAAPTPNLATVQDSNSSASFSLLHVLLLATLLALF